MHKIKLFVSLSLIALFAATIMISCEQESMDYQLDFPDELLSHVEVIPFEDYQNEEISSVTRKATSDPGTGPTGNHYKIKVRVNEDCKGSSDYILNFCANTVAECNFYYISLETSFNKNGYCREYLLNCNSFEGNCDF